MADRRARLAALAAKAGRSKPAEDDEQGKEEIKETAPTVTFRNYAPQDASLDAVDDDDAEPAAKRAKSEQKSQKSALEEALEDAQKDVAVAATTTDNVVAHMGPKKINWDLKRDVQDKLDKLEKRTQRAIVSLLKERLEREAAAEESGDEGDLD